jgi:hypothetical protein
LYFFRNHEPQTKLEVALNFVARRLEAHALPQSHGCKESFKSGVEAVFMEVARDKRSCLGPML